MALIFHRGNCQHFPFAVAARVSAIISRYCRGYSPLVHTQSYRQKPSDLITHLDIRAIKRSSSVRMLDPVKGVVSFGEVLSLDLVAGKSELRKAFTDFDIIRNNIKK